MYTGRLKNVRLAEDKNRKYMCVLNDVARSRQNLEKEIINKDKIEFSMLRERSMARVRKSFVKKLILKRCLDTNKGEGLTPRDQELFGQYGGRPLYSFARDVNAFLLEKHPKQRKKKQSEHMMAQAKLSGRILEADAMKEKVQDYLVTRLGVKLKQKKIEPNEHEQFKKPKPRTYEKLPPIFALYKVTLRPLDNMTKKQEDTHRHSEPTRSNDLPESHIFESHEMPLQPRKKRFYRKLECTRPNCGGYTGYYMKGQGLVLPPITVRMPAVNRSI